MLPKRFDERARNRADYRFLMRHLVGVNGIRTFSGGNEPQTGGQWAPLHRH
jgi:hypothetical protein